MLPRRRTVSSADEETAMESSEGVFLSNVSTDDWTPDPDVPGTEMHELVHEGDVWIGLTRILAIDGPLPWTPEQRETIHVLEGSVRIEFEGGPPVELGPGDLASFPAGLAMTWHVSTPFKELWILG
jgi:uncharacterized cupin superfamily protein